MRKSKKKYRQVKRALSAAETRKRIVRATFELHGEQGMAATTMKQIAARAGLGIGTVYHHFPKVEDTVEACAQSVAETMPLPDVRILDGVDGMNARLRKIAVETFSYYERIKALEFARKDQEYFPILRDFANFEDASRHSLTEVALAPFHVDKKVVRLSAALLDIGVYRALRRIGMDLEQAAMAISQVIEAQIKQQST